MNAFSGDQRFYSGDELRKHFRILIESASKIDIATAWVSESAILKLLVSEAVKVPIRMVVGVGGYATDPVVLKKLGTHPNVTLKIHGGPEPPLFHPKLYVFQHQHFRRALVGSMNFTNAGTMKNVESMLSTEDKNGAAGQEFERFWNSPKALLFDRFDLKAYEEKRRAMLAAVKAVGAADVLEEDVAASAESQVEIDALKEDWKTYVRELIASGDLQGHREVLAVRKQFINRDWSQELTEIELGIMYGKRPFEAFGRLNPVKQAQFQGSEGRFRRREIGAALESAATLIGFEEPLVIGIVQRLLDIHTVGPALATRLLVLVRPDLFVVVNRKSFEGLRERFDLFVSNDNFKAVEYVKLLRKLHETAWYKSPEPTDLFEQELWQARAAMIDPLVYREIPGAESDD